MENLRSTTTALLAGFALAALAAGCGGSTAKSGARSGQLDRGDRAFLAFTACMRAHRVHMSDPYRRPGNSGLTLDLPTKTPPTLHAYASCQHLIASVISMKEAGMRSRQNGTSYQQHQAYQLGLLHYAQCMRQHGVPMLDPDANGNLDLGDVPGIASIGRYTPQFRNADHACRSLLPPGLADNGTGP